MNSQKIKQIGIDEFDAATLRRAYKWFLNRWRKTHASKYWEICAKIESRLLDSAEYCADL